MMALAAPILALLAAIGAGAALPCVMADQLRLMGFVAFGVLVVSIVGGIFLGAIGSDAGRALLVFGLITALTAWTVAAPRLTSVVIWSLVASMLLSSALMLTLPIEFRALALWLALAVSLIWVAFQFWCYWDSRAWRVAGGLILISVVSGYVVFTIPPPV